MLTTRAFWVAAVERAVRTAAQTLLVTLGAGAVDLLSVAWPAALSLAGGAAVVSLLTSVVVSGVAGDGPALTRSETLVE